MPFDPASSPRTKTLAALRAIRQRVTELPVQELDMRSWPTCAIGQCRAIPEVKALGLYFDLVYSNPLFTTPDGEVTSGFAAIAQALNLPINSVHQVFSGLRTYYRGVFGEPLRTEVLSQLDALISEASHAL